MVLCDSPAIVSRTVNRLLDLGFYVCPSVFPAVPMNQPGIRFTITRHNDPAGIDAFIDALADALAVAIDEARVRGDAEGRAA
jgi:7-keto-8-aminopelargonate synthetase-like enzyme